MPRNPSDRDRESGFIWLPRDGNLVSDIKVDGVSVLYDYYASEFSKVLCPEIGSFKIRLINANGTFSNKYIGGETVQLYADFSTGTTKVFEGKIDTIKNVRESFDILEIAGGHISDDLLDLTVTKEYTGTKSCDTILKKIIDEYLTGYTYVGVETSTVTPNIKWNNKPFWNCVEDLCRLAKIDGRFDCYVDDDKGFEFFEENSRENTDEAIVWNDTLISLGGFGEKQTLVKNKIKVYGDDGFGLPIIRVSQDTASQTTYNRVKEDVIFDTSINTEDMALEVGDALIANESMSEDEGQANCFILPSLNPGEKIWVSEPTMLITKQIKVFRFTHKYPLEQTDVILQKSRTIPSVLRDQTLKAIASETIVNPYEMTKSINFTFDDTSKLASWDTNVIVSGGKLKIDSGTTGTATSETFTQNNDVTQVQILQVGEQLTELIYKVSTDNGDNYQTITPNSLSDVTPGKDLILKIFINEANTQLESVALLLK